MEVGATVWVKDKHGDEAWVVGIVIEKSAGKPCKVEIEVDEEFSEEPLSFTFSEDDGETGRELGVLVLLLVAAAGAHHTVARCVHMGRHWSEERGQRYSRAIQKQGNT